MAFQYGGITYHTDEANPNPLRDLITGAGLPGSGTSSYYKPLDAATLAKYGTTMLDSSGGGSEGGAGGARYNINWGSLPNTVFGPAYSISPVESGVKLRNSALQGMDSNFGQITPSLNVNNQQWSDYAGPVIMAALMSAMPLAIGAVGGPGAGLGGIGNTLFRQLGQTIMGGSTAPKTGMDPMTLLQFLMRGQHG